MSDDSNPEDQEPELTEDEKLEREIKARNKQLCLERSGIPRVFWGIKFKWPDSSSTQDFKKFNIWIDDIPGVYEAVDNLFIEGIDRWNRTAVVSLVGQNIMNTDNVYNRETIGYKHHIEADPLGYSQPFRFIMMDENKLVSLHRKLERDEEDITFEEEVSMYDFFCLLEFGDDWVTTYKRKVIGELLAIRKEAMLPTIITIKRNPGYATDKNENAIYEELGRFFVGGTHIKLEGRR